MSRASERGRWRKLSTSGGHLVRKLNLAREMAWRSPRPIHNSHPNPSKDRASAHRIANHAPKLHSGL
eukprot:10174342-Alexandrium_andersonii.AAC.1